jgi:hypothetical protein
LAAAIQDQLYFPDLTPLYAVCGVVAANMMQGYPVWLMMIGPPESGKTELLKGLFAIKGCLECGDLTGKAALLSGSRQKDRDADSTGGVLRKLIDSPDGGKRGALIMLDFARTVLAADPAAAREMLGSIGMLHDQQWQREIGTDGGRTLEFRGRIGFIAACTDSIDHPQYHQANAEMGERCLYLRYSQSTGYHEINSTLNNPNGSGKTKAIYSLFDQWRIEMALDWHHTDPPRALSDEEKLRIRALAQFCARGRSGVLRDPYHPNEIISATQYALGSRIANSLAQLLRGLERCGCTPYEIFSVLRRCAMDSIPAVRASAINLLRSRPRALPEIARAMRISGNAARRALEDLQVHGLVDGSPDVVNSMWSLSAECLRLLKSGWESVDLELKLDVS